MASIIKANKLQDFAGNELLTSDGSGNFTLQDKITTNNSALLKNTPAFEAHLNSSQTISHNTDTKVQFNTEDFDTDNTYDNSSNYRFTPAVAGKYFIYAAGQARNQTDNQLKMQELSIKKNGSTFKLVKDQMNGSTGETMFITNISAVMDLTATDYIEIFTKLEYISSGTLELYGTSSRNSYFGAYKLVGA